MALPWLTLLKSVPWVDVISNAPQLAEGAQKLWKVVSGKSEEPALGNAVDASASVVELTDDELRIAALEAEVASLNAEMLESSKLLKDLANQNAQLIERVEANRVRTVWLTVATALALILGLASLVLALR